MTSNSLYRIDFRYGSNANWTPVYETNELHKLYGMYKHLKTNNYDDDYHFRCCVLFGGHFRVIQH